MTRLFKLFGMRRLPARHAPFVDAADSECAPSSGWHESSVELRRGLTVVEIVEDADSGPETRPFTYQVEAA